MVPVKVKSPPIDIALVIDSVAPLVLLRVPPLMVNVPVPKAAAAFMFKVPSANVKIPEQELVPERVKLLVELLSVNPIEVAVPFEIAPE